MADFRALAKRLIDKNGRDVTIVQLTKAAADPTKPWRGPTDARASTTNVTGKGAFVPLGGSDLGVTFSDSAPDDLVFLFPAADDAGEKLEDFDEIIDGIDRWKIKETQFLAPGAERYLYFFRVAR